MARTAVQFGAGNIGRGFLAQLFHESRLEVVFVDVAADIVEAIRSRGAYPIQIVGSDAETIRIDNIRAVNGAERASVADEIARAEIVCTAVGAGALPHIASALAAGLLARYRASGRSLNILLCENLHDVAGKLRDAVAAHLPEEELPDILARTGFVQAVVSRMVPVQTPEERARDPLAIRVEAYKRLPVDANAIVGSLPAIAGVEPTAQFEAHVERKMYVHNCAHAVMGYLGHMAGYRYGYEALRDARISALLRAVLKETGEALIRKHSFNAREQREYVEDLLARFRNEALGDTCRRLARDPLRKLAPDDRLVGAARLCESQGIEPRALAWAIAGAMRYEDPEDPSACELQRIVRASGREAALERISGIRPEEPLAAWVREALDTTEPAVESAGRS